MNDDMSKLSEVRLRAAPASATHLAKHLLAGKFHLFVTPFEKDETVPKEFAETFGLEPEEAGGRLPAVLCRPGQTAAASSFEAVWPELLPFESAAVVSDRLFYRRGRDFARIMIYAPGRTGKKIVIAFRRYGVTVRKSSCTLDGAGLGILTFFCSEAGYYELFFENDDRRLTFFVVRENESTALAVEWERISTQKGRSVLVGRIWAFDRIPTGEADVEMTIEGGAENGTFKIPIEESGVIRLPVPRSRGRIVKLRISVAAPLAASVETAVSTEMIEKRTIAMHRFGREFKARLASFTEAEKSIQGFMPEIGATVDSPVSLLSTPLGKLKMTVNEDARVLLVTLVNPVTGKLVSRLFRKIVKKREIEFELNALSPIVLVGGFFERGPWEGWGSILSPRKMRIIVDAPSHARPHQDVAVNLKSDASEEISAFILVRDERLALERQPIKAPAEACLRRIERLPEPGSREDFARPSLSGAAGSAVPDAAGRMTETAPDAEQPWDFSEIPVPYVPDGRLPRTAFVRHCRFRKEYAFRFKVPVNARAVAIEIFVAGHNSSAFLSHYLRVERAGAISINVPAFIEEGKSCQVDAAVDTWQPGLGGIVKSGGTFFKTPVQDEPHAATVVRLRKGRLELYLSDRNGVPMFEEYHDIHAPLAEELLRPHFKILTAGGAVRKERNRRLIAHACPLPLIRMIADDVVGAAGSAAPEIAGAILAAACSLAGPADGENEARAAAVFADGLRNLRELMRERDGFRLFGDAREIDASASVRTALMLSLAGRIALTYPLTDELRDMLVEIGTLGGEVLKWHAARPGAGGLADGEHLLAGILSGSAELEFDGAQVRMEPLIDELSQKISAGCDTFRDRLNLFSVSVALGLIGEITYTVRLLKVLAAVFDKAAPGGTFRSIPENALAAAALSIAGGARFFDEKPSELTVDGQTFSLKPAESRSILAAEVKVNRGVIFIEEETRSVIRPPQTASPVSLAATLAQDHAVVATLKPGHHAELRVRLPAGGRPGDRIVAHLPPFLKFVRAGRDPRNGCFDLNGRDEIRIGMLTMAECRDTENIYLWLASTLDPERASDPVGLPVSILR